MWRILPCFQSTRRPNVPRATDLWSDKRETPAPWTTENVCSSPLIFIESGSKTKSLTVFIITACLFVGWSYHFGVGLSLKVASGRYIRSEYEETIYLQALSFRGPDVVYCGYHSGETTQLSICRLDRYAVYNIYVCTYVKLPPLVLMYIPPLRAYIWHAFLLAGEEKATQ